MQLTRQMCQECVITSPPGKHCHLPCSFILTDPSCHWALKHGSCLPSYLWLRSSKQEGQGGGRCSCSLERLPSPWHVARGVGRDCPNVAGMGVLGTWRGQEAGKG